MDIVVLGGGVNEEIQFGQKIFPRQDQRVKYANIAKGWLRMAEYIERAADKDNHVPTKAPNEPLTLEQLWEMKDELAYLKVFDPLLKSGWHVIDPMLKSGWHIIKAVTKDKIVFRGWQPVYVLIDGMGVDYNLYRRPPEGEEDK